MSEEKNNFRIRKYSRSLSRSSQRSSSSSRVIIQDPDAAKRTIDSEDRYRENNNDDVENSPDHN